MIEHLLAHALALAERLLTTDDGQIALASAVVAAAFNIAATFFKTMIPLRWMAAGGNLGFMVCGALLPSLPMLLLHAVLLPVNSLRAVQMMRLTRRVNRAADDRTNSGLWLRPYMTRRRFAAGEVLFRQGDRADRLYLLAEGRIELVEIGAVLEPGGIFGEIAFFHPARVRTLTARCLEPCLLLSINEGEMRQLYYQNPDFGFQLIGLVAGRMQADVERLRAQVEAAAHAAPPAV